MQSIAHVKENTYDNELFRKAWPLKFSPNACTGQSFFSIFLNSWVTRSLSVERKEESLLYCQHDFLPSLSLLCFSNFRRLFYWLVWLEAIKFLIGKQPPVCYGLR